MRNQVLILGVPIDRITKEEAVKKAIEFIKEGNSLKKVYTPNPEIVMLACKDKELMDTLKNGDIVIPDGIGLIIVSKIKRLGIEERVTGIDTMDKILHYCGENNKSIYILGGNPGRAETAAENIKKQYSGIIIAGVHHGYFKQEEENEIVQDINEKKPDVLFVCLGSPKQEKWIDKYKGTLHCKLAMGVGGSVDIYAGTAKRAPVIYQKLGMEWFYRLIKEPWRLKRMAVLPKFLIYAILKG